MFWFYLNFENYFPFLKENKPNHIKFLGTELAKFL
jgi:hypothetical protein